MSDTGTVYLPHDRRSATSDGLFGVYRRLRPRSKDVFAELSEG